MKTKTNFATTSDVRNLINATMETFPKGPVRDGIQTKMFNYWDNLNAGNNLPAGSDRKRFHAEALDNYKAAIRMAISLGSKRDSSYEFKVTELERRLTGIKVGKNEMAKVEDNFYGKRVVKGIFNKVNFYNMNQVRGLPDSPREKEISVVLDNSKIKHEWFLGHISVSNTDIEKTKQAIKNMPSLSKEDVLYWQNKVRSSFARTGSKAKFATNDPALANFLRKYKENEDRNYHSENILLLAKFVGSSDEVTQASMFVDLVKRMRGLPPEVKDEQYALYKRLAAKAKAKYPSTDFARQGSKTKFANGVYGNEEIAKGLSQVLKSMGFDTMASEILKGPINNETLRRYIRVLKSKSSLMSQNERGMFLLQTLEKQLASRTGSKAKFAKEYILWALPKGSTDRLDEKVMAEGLYTPAQVDDVKRRASADNWHSFRVVAMMSFDDMTNAFKGKGIKKRSSRTGAKAKFEIKHGTQAWIRDLKDQDILDRIFQEVNRSNYKFIQSFVQKIIDKVPSNPETVVRAKKILEKLKEDAKLRKYEGSRTGAKVFK